jgi:hypothetical protein
MAVTAVVLVVVVGAILFLLCCLYGFSRARKQKEIPGLLVGMESAGCKQGKTGRRLDVPRRHREISETTPKPEHISKNTVAVVGLAILLGSRSTSFAVPMSALASPHSKGKVPA